MVRRKYNRVFKLEAVKLVKERGMVSAEPGTAHAAKIRALNRLSSS